MPHYHETPEYLAGLAAGSAGHRREYNPYRRCIIQRTNWSLGWYAGRQAARLTRNAA